MPRAVLVLAALLEPLPAMAAQLGTASSPGIPWLRIALAFLLCIALAVGAILLLRRHQGRLRGDGLSRHFAAAAHIPRRQIAVIETRRVSQHGDVCLIHCHGHAYLLAVGQGHATVLNCRPLPPEDNAPGGMP